MRIHLWHDREDGLSFFLGYFNSWEGALGAVPPEIFAECWRVYQAHAPRVICLVIGL